MEGGLLLDVVVGEGPSVFELLASEDQPLLVRGDALLVLKIRSEIRINSMWHFSYLDLGLDILDGV